MANVTREEEQAIKEWQQRGGHCIDRVPTVEERIASNELEIAANLRILRAIAESSSKPQNLRQNGGTRE